MFTLSLNQDDIIRREHSDVSVEFTFPPVSVTFQNSYDISFSKTQFGAVLSNKIPLGACTNNILGWQWRRSLVWTNDWWRLCTCQTEREREIVFTIVWKEEKRREISKSWILVILPTEFKDLLALTPTTGCGCPYAGCGCDGNCCPYTDCGCP